MNNRDTFTVQMSRAQIARIATLLAADKIANPTIYSDTVVDPEDADGRYLDNQLDYLPEMFAELAVNIDPESLSKNGMLHGFTL